MKIAFIVEKFPTLSQTFVLNQITGLLDRGHELDIYAIGGPSRDIPGIEKDVEYDQILGKTYYYPLRIPAKFFLIIFRGLWRISPQLAASVSRGLRTFGIRQDRPSFRLLQRLYRTIPFGGSKKPYDVIHCQFGDTALRILRHRRNGILGSKLVTSFRGGDISSFLKKHGDQIYAPLFRSGDLFLTNCEHFRRRLVRLGCDEAKVKVHGSGIDCRKFFYRLRTASDDGPIRIVTTARLVRKKGIEYGIRAVAALVAAHPRIEYTIIGEGPLQKALEQLILELGVAGRVSLAGQKRPQEIVQILDRSHLFVACSVTAKDGNEDAPVNTLKEAMSMGLPVVATRHGGIPELVEDGVSGFLVPERDADAIAEKLDHLIRNPHLWPEMGRAGRTKVEEKYDKEKLNDELVEIYRQLLN